MKRWQQLEKAVADYLTLKKCSFFRVDHYRCFRCGQILNSRAKGFPDFLVYSPKIVAIEVKTGKGRLSLAQKDTGLKMSLSGVEFVVVRDNIDNLMRVL